MATSLKATVYSQTHAEVGTVDLPEAVFGQPVRRALLADMVRMQTANRRAGTASTKTRAFVSGGGKKPWKQKGTGRARAGSIRSPLWPGGATVFGPQPRDYSYTIPKRARKAALASILTQKVRENRLTIVDKIELPAPKTKHVAALVNALGINDTALLVITDVDHKVELAGRNLPTLKVLKVAGLNVYDLLHYHHLVITRAALDAISERVAA